MLGGDEGKSVKGADIGTEDIAGGPPPSAPLTSRWLPPIPAGGRCSSHACGHRHRRRCKYWAQKQGCFRKGQCQYLRSEDLTDLQNQKTRLEKDVITDGTLLICEKWKERNNYQYSTEKLKSIIDRWIGAYRVSKNLKIIYHVTFVNISDRPTTWWKSKWTRTRGHLKCPLWK